MKYPIGSRIRHKETGDIGFIINTRVSTNHRLVIFTGDVLPYTWHVDNLDQWVEPVEEDLSSAAEAI